MKGTVILYLHGVEYNLGIYTSKAERENIIARWKEKYGRSISAIGIIPDLDVPAVEHPYIRPNSTYKRNEALRALNKQL